MSTWICAPPPGQTYLYTAWIWNNDMITKTSRAVAGLFSQSGAGRPMCLHIEATMLAGVLSARLPGNRFSTAGVAVTHTLAGPLQ